MPDKKIKTVYTYNDKYGRHLYDVVRFEPKSFAPRRPVGNRHAWGLAANWYQPNSAGDLYQIKDCPPDQTEPPAPEAIWLDEIPKVLYKLPEITQSIESCQRILIVEGEKDCDRAYEMGIIATSAPFGANWLPSYTESLIGYPEAVIIADKDATGREYAETVVSALAALNIRIKVIELPDRNNCPVKDISDWADQGGTKEELEAIIDAIPIKEPEQILTEEDSILIDPMMKYLLDKHGDPCYLDKNGNVRKINQGFWAAKHCIDHTQLYSPEEKTFYRYDEKTGLWKEISPDTLKQEISSLLLQVSRDENLPSLESQRSNANLESIVSQMKGICEKRNAFVKDKTFVHLGNGVLTFNKDGEIEFNNFSPDFYSRNQSPILYDATARCDRFLNELLLPAISPADIVLLQKYAGLSLLGNNLIQRLLVLDGEGERGKSTIVRVIQKIVGFTNITQLRTQHLEARFELYRYSKKTLLVGVDVPGGFLSEKGAHIIKGLTGNDLMDTELKGSSGNFQIQGNYCIIIVSNSRLHVRLDGDMSAWKRRLLMIRFNAPPPLKKIPDFADLLITTEGSGILNWALEGLLLLLNEISLGGDIFLNDEQKNIVDSLLAESDSLRHFLNEELTSDENGSLTVPEIVEAYAEYCPKKGWVAKGITVIQRELEGLMLELFAVSKSNSIERNGKNQRGFRKVRFKNFPVEYQ